MSHYRVGYKGVTAIVNAHNMASAQVQLRHVVDSGKLDAANPLPVSVEHARVLRGYGLLAIEHAL